MGFLTRISQIYMERLVAVNIVNRIISDIEAFVRGLLMNGINFIFSLAFGDSGIVSGQLEMAVGKLGADPLAPQFNLGAGLTDFTVGASATVFDFVTAVANASILPIASTILAFVIAYDLVQTLMQNNVSIDADIFSITFKWVIKASIAIMILSSWHLIVGGIFELGHTATTGAIEAIGATAGLDTIPETIQEQLLLQDDDDNYYLNVGYVAIFFLLSFVLVIFFIIVSVIVQIIILARFFEIFVALLVAPIPMATITNNHWGQMGFNYIKTMLAYAFQGVLLFGCLIIYNTIKTAWAGSIAGLVTGGGGAVAIIGNLILFIALGAGLGVLLIMTLMRTPQIAKSIFGAA